MSLVGCPLITAQKILPPSAWDTKRQSSCPGGVLYKQPKVFGCHFLLCETPLRNKLWWWFQILFYVHPNPWGNDPICFFFLDGLVQPPTR